MTMTRQKPAAQKRPDQWQTAAELSEYFDCHPTTLGAKAMSGETFAGFTIERLEVADDERDTFGARTTFKYRALRLVQPSADVVELRAKPAQLIPIDVTTNTQPELPLRPGRVSPAVAAAVLLAEVAAELAGHAPGSLAAVEATTIAAWLAKRATR